MASDTKACSTWLSMGKRKPGKARDARGAAGDGHADLCGADRTARGLDPDDACAFADEAGHFTVLDDVDAAIARGARVAPHDGIVPRGAAASLQKSAVDRKAGVLEVEKGQHAPHAARIEQFRIDAVHAHGVAAACVRIALRIRVIQVQHAALAHHGVVIELLLESLPELHRPLVEGVIAGQQIVRADDRGIAPGIAGADPAFLEDGDFGDAVDLGKVVSGCEPMATAADDDDVVRSFGVRRRARPASSRDGDRDCRNRVKIE